MDFDSSSKFIASLAKFLQSLCNGYVEFDNGVQVIGHIYLNVDSDTGKKIDYVLNEKVCKNNNSVTFISNSFHAQPAEKPQPPKKAAENDKFNDDSVISNDTGQPAVPSSTNVGTMGSFRSVRGSKDSYSPGSKRPGSPLQQKTNSGQGYMGRQNTSQPQFSDSGGHTKIAKTIIPQSPRNNYGEYDEYNAPSAYQSGGDDYDDNSQSYYNSDNHTGANDVDQKPVIDPDISIVKEELLAGQQNSGAFPGQPSGPGRGGKTPVHNYPMQHQQIKPPNFSTPPQQSDTYPGSSLEGAGDPSTLTRAQQEELEMYYRKGTDQHLTFLRNMREAHAMYPFTGKRDKELFDKALAELFKRMPLLQLSSESSEAYFIESCRVRAAMRYSRLKTRLKKTFRGQFKSPGQSPRGGHYGRQMFPGGHMSQQGYPYQSPGYPDMSSRASEGGDSFLQGPGDESYGYQQQISDDSQGTQGIQGFHGAFGNTGGEQEVKPGTQDGGGGNGQAEDTGGNGQPPGSPPDIKYEITPISYLKSDDFELIEIDEDDDI